jgi:hypothetical protein
MFFNSMDGRRNNGGHKTAGRKSKAEEVNLIEKLSPLEDAAYIALKDGVERGDFKFVQLFYNYYAGKPRETKDITINEDLPLFMED